MHKSFYASGFLYHPPTQQILLQQTNEIDLSLSTFGGEGSSPASPEEIFKNVLAEKLGVRINTKDIYRVYDYFHDGLNLHYFLLYAEFPETSLDFTLHGSEAVGWFPIKQIGKLKMTSQIRQDITVGQRVINYTERQKEVSVQDTES